MPADVDKFDMLRRGVLEGLTLDQLNEQLTRVANMREAVEDYYELVRTIIWAKRQTK